MKDRFFLTVGSMAPQDAAKVIQHHVGVETLTWEKVFARRRGAHGSFAPERLDGWKFVGEGRQFRYRVQNCEGLIWEIT